jgi:POT family proton-dependent oligopeptide transporter
MITYFVRHNKETYYYAVANFLERASFFGVRALILGYLMSPQFAFPEAKVLSILELIAGTLILTRIMGACLGDLMLGNIKVMVLGGLIQALGMLMLCIPQLVAIYTGIALIVIGNGMFSPNITASFGKLYLSKTKMLDGGYAMFYTSIIIGAFVGGLFISSSGAANAKLGFIISAGMMLVSTMLCYMANDDETQLDGVRERRIDFNTRVTHVLLAFGLVGLFWFIYEFTSTSVVELQSKLNGDLITTVDGQNWLSQLKLIITLIVGIGVSIHWSNKYIHQYKKMTIGFLTAAFSLSILLLMNSDPTQNGNLMLMLSMGLMSVGEMFIAPLLYSILAKYGNPKYLAILISCSFIPSSILFIKTPHFIQRILENTSLDFGIGSICFFAFAVLSFILFRVYKRA